MVSKSAIHENLATNLMTVGTIFIIGADIISMLENTGIRFSHSRNSVDMATQSASAATAPRRLPKLHCKSVTVQPRHDAAMQHFCTQAQWRRY